MNFETFGNEEGNYTDSFNDFINVQGSEKSELIQEVETKETPNAILESLIDEAIANNQKKENEPKFIKELTPEQRKVIIINAQEFLQTMWGKESSFQKTDKLRVTVDETHLYIRICRDKNTDWEDINWDGLDARKATIPKAQKPNTRAEKAAAAKEKAAKTLKEGLWGKITEALVYNDNVSNEKREAEKEDRLFPLTKEISSNERTKIFEDIYDLWFRANGSALFIPDHYTMEITIDPETQELVVRLRKNDTKLPVGMGGIRIER